jgi:hypothetical protein
MQSNEVYCDTEPCGPRCASRRTDAVLASMGDMPRGYSAFRKGLATRAMTLSILKSKGLRYESSVEVVEDMLLRVGGWDLMLSYRTLKTCYIAKVIDEYACLFGLSMGRQGCDEEWQQLLTQYMGKELCPSSPPVQNGRKYCHGPSRRLHRRDVCNYGWCEGGPPFPALRLTDNAGQFSPLLPLRLVVSQAFHQLVGSHSANACTPN